MNASTQLARAAVAGLIEAGITEIVLCPGSRNAPMSFALSDAEASGAVRLHIRIDERSAAFLALGLTKAGKRAAVVCTSGTAVANFHPAMLEAAHSGLALVAVTADRPEKLRGTGASQTTDQVGIFGNLIETSDIAAPGDLDVDALWSAWGPAHWNLQFDVPLLPEDPEQRWVPQAIPRPAAVRPQVMMLESIDVGVGAPRTVVLAADGATAEAAKLAEAAGWPLFAEPSSGVRSTPNAVGTYRVLLGHAEWSDQIERVIVFGNPTLSRPVAALLASPKVEVWSQMRFVAWGSPAFEAHRTFRTELHLEGDSEGPNSSWLAHWIEAGRSIERQLRPLLHGSDVLTGPAVAAVVAAAVHAESAHLVVGASNPIRDLDLVPVRQSSSGERAGVFANRGLAGIDGVVSTAVGVALADEEHPTIALMGDLTFIHDSNGLVIGPGEPRPAGLVIVVNNDDGGSIFATLEQGAPAYADRFERIFGTPHGTNLESLCAATQTPFTRVTNALELEQALSSPNGGIEVVEAVIDRAGRRALDEAVAELKP